MPTLNPVGYNPSQTPISGTIQIGNLAIGTTAQDYSSKPGGITYWMTPNQDFGYVVAKPIPSGNQPTRPAIGATAAYVGFSRSPELTDSSFVSLVNSIAAGATAFTNTQGPQAKTWLNANGYWTSYLGIVTNGLIIQLDADNSSSYPGTGSTVYDITGSYNHTLTNAPYTVLNGVKCFDANGTSTTIIEVIGTGPTLPTSGYTYITWGRIRSSSATWRTLFRTLPDDHPILVQLNTDNLGFYDNGTASFIDSGYDVTSIEEVWVQYAVVGDNSSSTFYINGAQVGNTVAYGAGGNRHWAWGAITSQPFGYVANMYLYNRKLSLSEITQQYDFLSPRFNPVSPVSSNLVLYYDPSNPSSYPGSGTTMTDLTGNGLNATLSNITYTDPALNYNGTSSTSSTSDNSLLEPGSGDWTIEIWINYSVISGSSRCVMSKTNGGLAADWGYGIRTTSSGATYLEVGNGTTSVTSPSFTVSTNTWYQIVGVWTNVESNSIALYINGVSKGSNSHSFTSVKNTTGALSLGSFNNNIGGFGQWVNGKMGIVRIYSSALTGDQILQNYYSAKRKYGL